jgi:hypothetical protein
MVALVGCAAAAKFNYRYYAIEAADYRGKLKGPRPEDDISFEACKPVEGKAAPCIAMLKDAYLQLKADYLQLSQQLSDCQRGK